MMQFTSSLSSLVRDAPPNLPSNWFNKYSMAESARSNSDNEDEGLFDSIEDADLALRKTHL